MRIITNLKLERLGSVDRTPDLGEADEKQLVGAEVQSGQNHRFVILFGPLVEGIECGCQAAVVGNVLAECLLAVDIIVAELVRRILVFEALHLVFEVIG